MIIASEARDLEGFFQRVDSEILTWYEARKKEFQLSRVVCMSCFAICTLLCFVTICTPGHQIDTTSGCAKVRLLDAVGLPQ